MRAILPLLAAACLLTFAGIGRAEFDSGSIGPAKAKATGATFDASTAATRATRNGWLKYDVLDVKIVAGPAACAIAFAFKVSSPTPQRIIKNPSNVPRPKH